MPTEDKVRIHVVLSAELVRHIDELVGKGRRSAFIRDALAERMKRERLRGALDATAGALKGRLPPEWEEPGGAAKWVRKSRAGDDERLRRIWGSDQPLSN